MQTRTKRILISLWVVGLLAPFLWLARLLFGTPATVDVSEETTVLTGKTLEDGSLDFSAALWQRCNSPVPDSENAAVELSKLPVLQNSWQRYQRIGRQLHPDRYSVDKWNEQFSKESVNETMRSQTRLWTANTSTILASMIKSESRWVPLLKRAVKKPRLRKPIGITIERLTGNLTNGGDILLRRAMLAGGEGRWEEMVNDLRDVDRGADLLAQLQCGWQITHACQMRQSVSRALEQVILDVKHVDPILESYIRERALWPVADVLATAIDNAMRIHFQIAVRDLRSRENWLRSIVGGGLVGTNEEARNLQLARIRNSIDWTLMSRLQNEHVDAYVEAMTAPGYGQWYQDYLKLRLELSNPNTSQLLESVRKLHLANISRQIGAVISSWSQSKHLAPVFIHRQRMERSLKSTLTALELALFREQQGHFPASLDELGAVAQSDLFRQFASDQQLKYSCLDGEVFELGQPRALILRYSAEDNIRYQLSP